MTLRSLLRYSNTRADYEPRWQDRWFTGHLSIGPLTVYGANAMHWSINLRTPWGYLCFHPTTRTFGGFWPWYLYLSDDATPTRRRWGIGPGLREYGPRCP